MGGEKIGTPKSRTSFIAPEKLAAVWSMTMVLRPRLKFGDVFAVPLAEGRVGYLQYVADDATQLDSYVIRAFEGGHDAANPPAVAEIVSGRASFYAHVFLKNCVKFGFWKKIGNAPYPDKVDTLFRCCRDYGEPGLKISRRWYVWRINEPERDIGALTPAYHGAEFGTVLPPQSIVARMLTGSYDFEMPD